MRNKSSVCVCVCGMWSLNQPVTWLIASRIKPLLLRLDARPRSCLATAGNHGEGWLRISVWTWCQYRHGNIRFADTETAGGSLMGKPECKDVSQNPFLCWVWMCFYLDQGIQLPPFRLNFPQFLRISMWLTAHTQRLVKMRAIKIKRFRSIRIQ